MVGIFLPTIFFFRTRSMFHLPLYTLTRIFMIKITLNLIKLLLSCGYGAVFTMYTQKHACHTIIHWNSIHLATRVIKKTCVKWLNHFFNVESADFMVQNTNRIYWAAKMSEKTYAHMLCILTMDQTSCSFLKCICSISRIN